MSELVVEVCRIESVERHPNADSLSIAKVKGWGVCFNHDSTSYAPGDEALYVPPDTLVPMDLAESWGVAGYLSVPKSEPAFGRVQSVRLRGVPSHGFLVDPDGRPTGVNFANDLGLRKWEPPASIAAGDEDRPIAAFHKYTSIENWRHYPGIIATDEQEAMRVEVARLRKALGNCWCPRCRGARMLQGTSHRGDPRDDNGSSVWRCCPTCGGSGLHPAAAAALQEVRDE